MQRGAVSRTLAPPGPTWKGLLEAAGVGSSGLMGCSPWRTPRFCHKYRPLCFPRGPYYLLLPVRLLSVLL